MFATGCTKINVKKAVRRSGCRNTIRAAGGEEFIVFLNKVRYRGLVIRSCRFQATFRSLCRGCLRQQSSVLTVRQSGRLAVLLNYPAGRNWGLMVSSSAVTTDLSKSHPRHVPYFRMQLRQLRPGPA